jgi:ATP-binding cassette, subfamily C, bacterial CydC
MKILLRLLKDQVRLDWRLILASFLGCATIASNLILLSVAAYLVTAASVARLLILLAVPVYFVQLMGIARPLARYAERYISHDLTLRLLTRLRVRVYACLEPLAPSLLLSYRSGDLLARLMTDIDELQNVYLRILSPIVIAAGIILLTCVILVFFSSPLAWIALAFLAFASIGVPLLSWQLTRGAGRQQLATRAEEKALLVDSIQGMQDLLAYGQAGAFLQKAGTYDHRLGRLQQRMARVAALQEALIDLCRNGAMWCVLLLAIPLITGKQIDSIYLGSLALLILASFEVVQPLGQAAQFLGHSLAAGQRLFTLTDTRPAVVDPVRPAAMPVVASRAAYELAFEQVSFAYSAAEPPVLNKINLRLRPGSHIALVGSSGAGKSTLLRLALRCWDPSKGRITLNGRDLREYALADLRAVMGVVTQDTYLFNTTLGGNLLLARPEASNDELMSALEQAQLGEFVRQLPRGLDTHIGEQGLRLSGGERQRLAIARALLKDAPVLLLDEVTANLDPRTEQEVIATLRTLMQGRTTLLITHHLAGLEHMGEVVVLEDGAIKEQGTVEQLTAQQGRYAELLALQESILAFCDEEAPGASRKE